MRLLGFVAIVLALLAGPVGAEAAGPTFGTEAPGAGPPAPSDPVPPTHPVLTLPASARAATPIALSVTARGAAVATPVRWTLAQTSLTRRLRSPGGALRLPGLSAGDVVVTARVGATVLHGWLVVAPTRRTRSRDERAARRRSTRRARPPQHAVTGARRAGSDRATPRLVARVASGVSVGIRDFSFAPKTITVSVGDAVTWRNNGQQPHTATAKDGSFDTGLLKHGQSASHTFTKAGTYAYVCTVHPFMKGTVVVRGSTTPASGSGSSTPAPAASGSTGSGSTGSGSTPSASTGSGAGHTTGGTSPGVTVTSPATTAATPAGPTLPNTGDHPLGRLALGIALLGLGLVARRSLRGGA